MNSCGVLLHRCPMIQRIESLQTCVIPTYNAGFFYGIFVLDNYFDVYQGVVFSRLYCWRFFSSTSNNGHPIVAYYAIYVLLIADSCVVTNDTVANISHFKKCCIIRDHTTSSLFHTITFTMYVPLSKFPWINKVILFEYKLHNL